MITGGGSMHASEVFMKLQGREPGILNQKKYRKSAVLLPIVEVDGESHILFEVRSKKMRTQPGDICFPGGRVEQQDTNEMATAIRETTEELGVLSEYISNVIPLDYIVSDMGGIIYPFVGKLSNIGDIQINQLEVEEVFTVPLNYFIHTEPEQYKIEFDVLPERDFPYELIQNGENYNWRQRKMNELFYVYHPRRVIWGLTARILYHFVELMKEND